MAIGRQSVILLFFRSCRVPGWLWPGMVAALFLLLLAVSALASLWLNAPATEPAFLFDDPYLQHVLRFTLMQAGLSTLFSVFPAIFLARALARRRFIGRALLVRLFSLTLVLPVLVAVFGLISVYGQNGWLAQLCRWLGIHYRFSPYGLQGILLAHVFFNLPLACRLFLQSLEAIPLEQRRLAAQLGMNAGQRFRFLEWPYLRRQLLPTASLIFMLCFASFAVVLALGGGPKATSIELAIYQALTYDFDLGQAALLALLQMAICLGLVVISQRLAGTLPAAVGNGGLWHERDRHRGRLLGDLLLIGAALLLLLPPLLSVLVSGLNLSLWSVLRQAALWQALLTSLQIALGAGALAVILGMMILWSSRQLRMQGCRRWAARLELSGMLILAMPGLVLATGLFLLLQPYPALAEHAMLLVIICNALMALPYVLKTLSVPMWDLAVHYNRLCASLGIQSWQRLRWVEWRALARPLSLAMSFSCVLSLGDFGVIALLGSDDLRTLPLYLYQQIGAYRSNDAAVTALLLMLLCFGLFTFFERLPRQRTEPRS